VTVTRLVGGLTPGDGSDPRTFPAIFNAAADVIDANESAVASQGSAIADLESDVEDLQDGLVGGTAVYRYVTTLYFTSNGTFSKASYPWLRAIRVKVQGGGGSGGGAAATSGSQIAIASGGAGGAYAESFITNISGLASSETVTRGAGGAAPAAGANAGNAGGASSFGSLVSANGGGGGDGGSAQAVAGFPSTPINGQTTATGDLVIPGGASFAGTQTRVDFLFPVPSGAAFLGGSKINGVSAAAGVTGSSFGGGGTGGQNTQNSTAKAGGAGGNGIVIVELYA
jgi:hypothetical protein